MNEEQAIEIIETHSENILSDSLVGRALDMAIDALKAQLSPQGTTFDMISRQDALNIFDDYNVSVENGELEAYSRDRKRLLGLPTVQPEPSHTQKSCEYCHEDSDGYTRPIEKNCHAYIRFGMNGWELDLKAKGWHGEAQIKFCPMCGRKLQGGR